MPISCERVRGGARRGRRLPSGGHRRAGTCRHSTDDCGAVSVRRRPEPDGRAARPPVVVARDARGRSTADVSRSSARRRRQPARHFGCDASGTHRDRRGDGSTETLPLFARRCRSSALLPALCRCDFRSRRFPNDTLEHVREKERALAALTARGSALVEMETRCGRLVRRLVRVERRTTCRRARFRICRTRSSPRPAHCRREPPRRYLDAAERDRRARADSFIGSWSSPRCFSTATASVARRRLRRGDRQSAVGHAARRHGLERPARRITGRPRRRSCGSRASRRLHARSPTATRIVTSSSPNARSRLTRPGGRLGLVLPAGLAIDRGSAALRRMLLSRCRRRRDRRPRQSPRRLSDSSQRPFSAGHGDGRIADAARSRAGSASTIRRRSSRSAMTRRHVDVVPDRDHAGAARAHLGRRADHPVARTTRSISRSSSAPRRCIRRLAASDGWRARFGRELNATDDRDAFRAAGAGLPVVDGKHLEPFRVDVGAAAQQHPRRAMRRGASRVRRARAAATRLPRRRQRRRIALTLIAAVLPAGCVSTHTVFCLRTPLPLRAQHFLCGIFNSLVVNFLVRLRVSTHVTTAIVEQLPIPTWSQRAGGVPGNRRARAPAREDARPAAFARLNARVATLYQLTRDEFEHVLDHVPADSPRRTRRVPEGIPQPQKAEATKMNGATESPSHRDQHRLTARESSAARSKCTDVLGSRLARSRSTRRLSHRVRRRGHRLSTFSADSPC